MTNAAKKIVESVFHDVEIEKPSVIQSALNEGFALVPITDDHHLAAANHVVENIIDFLSANEENEPQVAAEMRKYLSVLSDLIGAYENARFSGLGENVSGADVLRFLMDAHGLKQTDLAEEVGGQSVVSEILRGSRELNAKQIRRLADRFKVSPSAFF